MSDVEALAEVLRDGEELAYDNIYADWARLSIARTIVDSDWLTGHVAAERDRAVREALAPVRALAEGWDEKRRPGMVGISKAIRAALPDDCEGEGA